MNTALLIRTVGLMAVLAIGSVLTREPQARGLPGPCLRVPAGTQVGFGTRTGGGELRIVRGELRRATPQSIEVRVEGRPETFNRERIEWMLVACNGGTRRAASFAGGAIVGGLAGALLGGVASERDPGPDGLAPNRGTEAVVGGVRTALAAGLVAALLVDGSFRDWADVDPRSVSVTHPERVAEAHVASGIPD
jgi:hypothetical protein